MKKIFNLLGELSILTFYTISCTFAYTQEQYEAYQWAYRYGLTTQSSIESAKMNGPITRQAFSKMVVNYLENVVGINGSTTSSCHFLDENKITNDLKSYTKKACTLDIMGTNGKNFNPGQLLNRAQLGTVLSRILWGDKHNASGTGYYIYHVNALQEAGIMKNIKNVVGTNAKRGDVMIMLKRMYEKFGTNVYLYNGNQDDFGKTNSFEDVNEENISTNNNLNVIYKGKDGKEYVYNKDFLNLLKNEANKKGESDLTKYIEVESEYYLNGLDQLESLDLDSSLEMLGINESINPDKMTKKEKETLVKKAKDLINKLTKENKNKNNEYINKLNKVVKNIKNDKFGLREKYEQTKEFFDNKDSFIAFYSKSILEVMDMVLTSKDGEIDENTGMGIAFEFMGAALTYEGEVKKYQDYIEQRGVNTINILGLNS